jgi:hypothetical protein
VWFACWAVVGAAYAFGLIGALSIGMFVLPCALVTTFYLARRSPAPRFMTGLVSGLGVSLLILAFLHRRGPGMVCDGSGCEHQFSPWPWFVAGVLFVLLGVAVYVLSATRRRGA